MSARIRLGRWRFRAMVVSATVMAATSLVSVSPSPALPLDPAAAPARAYVEPALTRLVAAGPTTAIFSFDQQRTTRSSLQAQLAARGLQAHVFEAVPVAYACAGSVAALHRLAAVPGVEAVYGDAPLTPALDQSVPTAFNGDPHNVWDGMGITGKGVGIAVLDTGVDATHPDLQYGSRVKHNVRVVVSHRDLFGPYQDPCVADTYTQEMQDSELTSGHGTHMAGIVGGDGIASGGRYVGVAPEADIMGVGIDETLTPQQSVDATGTQLSMLGAIAGFNYILLHGLGDTPDSMTVKVVLAGWIQSGLYDPWHPMALALLDLASFGITVVFPAGNNGPDASNCSEAATCHMNAWAPSTVAITVAATPKTSRTVLEPYSSRGDPAWRTFHDETFRYAPSISAPGTRVMSARRIGLASVAQPPAYSMTGASGDGISLDRRYVALTGTSVAAAHVAGAIALMQQAAFQAGGCYLTPQQVKSILQSTATAMPGTSPVDVGAGMVDITHAVMASRGAC